MQMRFSVPVAIVAGIVLSCAGAASASAKEFTDSIPGGIEAKATSAEQVFKTAGGTVECPTLTATGTAAAKSATQDVIVTYEKCNGFGIKVVITAAEYEFNDEHESVSILKPIDITAKEGGADVCGVVVPAQANLKRVTFNNFGTGEIEVSVKVEKIESEGSGTLPTCKYAKESVGTYNGTSLTKSTNGGLLKA